jgi:hypothetical protein
VLSTKQTAHGCCAGYIDEERAQEFAATLRYLKVTRQEDIPLSLEIAVLTKDASSLAPAVRAWAAGPCGSWVQWAASLWCSPLSL